ncbi:MAG: signal peptidase I, partial [Thermoguttaceae bacterium]
MSKRPPPIVNVKTPPAAEKKSFFERHRPTAASTRETIEALAMAFVLAFLFRTFEAEAFVIPTGSMATTLLGRHKDPTCPKCHYQFRVSSSEEVDHEGRLNPFFNGVESCICPMCGYTVDIDGGNAQPSYSGDRIIVNKFCYQIEEPKRWDVIVFYYPEGARDNYIKRLAGLPDETLHIQFGDLWTRKNRTESSPGAAGKKFSVARKPPQKLLAMLQPVFDNDYMPAIAKCGWPQRWESDQNPKGLRGDWTSDDLAAFHTDGTAHGEVWLRYRHLVPSSEQWKNREEPALSAAGPVKPQLITDFTAYNTGSTLSASIAPTPSTVALQG